MTREEAIQELQNCKGLIQQDGQDYLDERDIPLLDMAIEALSAEDEGANLINRHDAVTVIREECWKCNNMINDDLFMRIMSLPTSQQTDCTEFIMWLVEVVLDDEDWELNAVSYGEVIARKLKKLGLLEVKDGYYIRHIENNTKESDLVYRPPAEAAQWIDIDDYYRLATCSHCHKVTMFEKWGEHTIPYDFCPNCGWPMKMGGDDE